MQLDRRAFVGAGLLGLLTPLTMFSRTAPEAASRGQGRARSCILVYLLGGASHIDMWDPKPDAPAEIRGPFQTIATTLPSVRVSEHLPQLANQMQRLALVRSVTYPNHDHPFMIYYTLTGRVSPTPLGANTVLPPSRSDYPHLGAVVSRFRHENPHVPAYVAIPEVQVRMQSTPVSGGGRAGFLGPRHDPLAINDDPGRTPMNWQLPADVSPERFERRSGLLAVLEGAGPQARVAVEHEEHRRAAGRLVCSGSTRDLFALEQEPARLRERYGNHRFGRSLLLSRRLVERGVSLVSIHFNHMTRCDGWDTHANNFNCLREELLPLTDQGVSALLEDLHQQGMLDETLVVVLGEFGRTPRINGQAGRDHWGHCASVVLAGGGIRGGQVFGASDRHAAYPREQPVDPADIQATIYHALGLSPDTEMHDQLGRPLTISTGRPVLGLF